MSRRTQYPLEVGGFTVHVQRKAVKALRLRVRAPEGSLHASVPFRVSDRDVQRFVYAKRDWIADQQARCVARQRPPHTFLPGSAVPLWGVMAPLRYGPAGEAEAAEGIHLPQAAASSQDRRKAAVHAFYRRTLESEIAQRLPRWESRLNTRAEHWSIRNMRSRWGSCNTSRRRLNLSLRLIAHPVECLDYVLVHELAHLWVARHDRQFWQLVAQAMPDWQVHHQRLRQAGHDDALW
ncbi:M48 family metallopeptidase [Algiphilus sp.]|uniref:M48 family metallopeptidase n=1 Tax=Algiphilus sp. TaxID=1872431 RepID=UPI003B516084